MTFRATHEPAAADTHATSTDEAATATRVGGEARHKLPVIVIGEYRDGLQRSRLRRRLTALLDDLVRESTVLVIDVATAAAYARLRELLRSKGTPIPENDVWIGALAIEHRLEIVSRDSDFDRVPGIRRRSW